jgi:hypothetical protein
MKLIISVVLVVVTFTTFFITIIKHKYCHVLNSVSPNFNRDLRKKVKFPCAN